MEKNEPNKIVTALYKKHKNLLSTSYETTEEKNKYWEEVEKLKTDLSKITCVVGAIEVMSKNSLLKLIAMQSSLRFLEPFRFLNICAKATEDLNL